MFARPSDRNACARRAENKQRAANAVYKLLQILDCTNAVYSSCGMERLLERTSYIQSCSCLDHRSVYGPCVRQNSCRLEHSSARTVINRNRFQPEHSSTKTVVGKNSHQLEKSSSRTVAARTIVSQNSHTTAKLC